jgi:group I intron endonuclease
MGIIYCLTSPSGKKYVGQTTRTLEARLKEHIKYNDCKSLYAAIVKYGIENFAIETLEQCPNEELDNREKHYIHTLNTMCPNGYNIRSGGSNGFHCEDSKKRMSESKKGDKNHNFGKPRTDEAKKNISIAKAGENHHFFNKTFTEEHKIKLAKSHRKHNEDLPLYLTKCLPRLSTYSAGGYAITNHPTLPNKYFTSKKLTDAEKYRLALEYLQTSAVHRLNVDGSD